VHIPVLASIGAAVVGVTAVVGTVVLVATAPQPQPQALWIDSPVAGVALSPGDLTVTMHTNEPQVTSIRAVIATDGNTVAVLTDNELETLSRGKDAKLLYVFDQVWNAQPGTYTITATAYAGSTARSTAKAQVVVLGAVATPDATPSPDTPPPTEPSAEPTPSATPAATPSATPSAGPTPQPTAKPTTKPTSKPTTKPTTPPASTPQPSHTTDPIQTPTPVVPAAGKATRSNETNSGWTNTFTITGIRPNTAQVYIDINLHNTVFTPYFAGWKSYPCGNLTLYSGSGADATYQCSVTVTIEPPGNWRSGEFWLGMPDSVYRPKIVSGGKTYYGVGGNWTVAAK
jgi:hypothetical protein